MIKDMIGSIIGAGLSAAGAIAGGIMSAKAMKNVKKNLNRQMQDNDSWYNAAQPANRKAARQQKYRATQSARNSQLNDLELQRAQAIGQAVQGVTGAGASIAGALG